MLSALYRRLGKRYLWLYTGFDLVSSLTLCVATAGLFAMYEPMSIETFLLVVGFAEVCVLVALVYVFFRARRLVRPMSDWIAAGRPPDGALEAWRAGVSLPRRFVRGNGWKPFAMVALPVAVFVPWVEDLPVWSGLIVFAGSLVAIAYATVLHFFASETFLRPVVEDAARRLPAGFEGAYVGVPLRWKLLGAIPVINVITGVVVSGLSTDGQARLQDLGIDVLVAVAVASTLSLELAALVSKSITRPVDDLLRATERVKQGDFDARVPVTSGDEIGRLAGSFNEMMTAVSEREALRGALGSYVDPEVAERVLDEGEMLEGQEAEVTVMIVDMRDFTPFAERSSARETVARLNEFFELVVPIILRNGGHANKFLGDGLLAVFGAPERLEDHADRALQAGCDIVREVDSRFGAEVRVGVGLNSGPVVVGSVGGGGRLEFAVIGDTVNVAARVEGTTRETGDAVLVTEATRCLLVHGEIELEERSALPLKGKSEPVSLYAAPVLDSTASSLDERTRLRAQRLTADA